MIDRLAAFQGTNPYHSQTSSPAKHASALNSDDSLNFIGGNRKKSAAGHANNGKNQRSPSSGNTVGTIGNLFLTATHLIFVSHDEHNEQWILHHLIASVEKLATTTLGCPLYIRCKHFLALTFIIPRERDAHDIYLSLTQLSSPPSIERLYCFTYSAADEPDLRHDQRSGWDFDMTDEYRRMGLPNGSWIISDVNVDYKLCDTYPEKLAVPRSITNSSDGGARILSGSAKFRSRGRLPILTYWHAESGAGLCRCAQPLVGLSNRSSEDEILMAAIRESSDRRGRRDLLYVVDTRPKVIWIFFLNPSS